MTDLSKHSKQLQQKREHSATYESKRYCTPKRKEYEAEFAASGRRKEVEKTRYDAPKRKEYEAEFVASGKRKVVETLRKEKDEETGRRI